MPIAATSSVDAFFKRFEGGMHAELKGLYGTYKTVKEFEEKLSYDLDTLIARNFLHKTVSDS